MASYYNMASGEVWLKDILTVLRGERLVLVLLWGFSWIRYSDKGFSMTVV